jgi:hypothetical protein
LYQHNGEWFKYMFLNIIFKGKKLMQWLEFPLQPKGPRFEPFFELYFSSTKEMDENNSQSKKRFKLLPREQPCSQKRKA